MAETKKESPEITFIRGNCGLMWGCKDGIPSGPIITMGDMIAQKELRKEWIKRNRPEDCMMDLKSFRDFIDRNEWTFAKAYATFCPHEYVVMKRLPGKEWPLFPEIARFIRENGFAAEYGRLGVNWYYVVDDYYYWTMDEDLEDTDLINRAKLADFEFVEMQGKTIVRRKPSSQDKVKSGLSQGE